MITMGKTVCFVACVLAMLCSGCSTERYIEIPESVLLDKVKGGWAAKMFGVEYGAPFEFKYCGTVNEEEITWSPERIEGSLYQDDLYVQLNFMMTLERLGLDAPTDSVAKSFAASKFPLWHANLQAKKNYFAGIPSDELSLPENSIHCEDIDFQIESDFIGIINPSMFRSLNSLALRIGPIVSHADGLYGGIFVAAMDAAAFKAESVEEVVAEALKTIPYESGYAECIRDVVDGYHKYPENWKKTWTLLEEKWGKTDICSPESPLNIDAKLNGAYIVMGLLYGAGDFEKTVEIAVRCGQDADCNASSAAGVLGILYGYDAIPDRFKDGLANVADKKFLYTDYSFNDAVRVSMDFVRRNVLDNGGRVKDGIYYIKRQQPETAPLQYGPDNVKYSYQQYAGSGVPEWHFDEYWKKDDWSGCMVSDVPGAKMTVEFDGTGIALVGRWNMDCGMADVFVDGNLLKRIDAFFPSGAGLPDALSSYLCHITGLNAGTHELELVISEDHDSRSSGHKVYVEKVIVYE